MLVMQNTGGVRPARLQVTTDYLRGVWSQEVNLGWRMLVSLNTFYFAIQTYRLFVLYLLPRARRVNRSLINNSNNLPVETCLPWISCSSVSICLLNFSLSCNFLYTGLRNNLALLVVCSVRHLPQWIPFGFSSSRLGLQSCNLCEGEGTPIQLSYFFNQILSFSRG